MCRHHNVTDEAMHSWNVQVKVEDFQNKGLHLQYLLLRVGIVCDVDELSHLWRIDFFVFAEEKLLLSNC